MKYSDVELGKIDTEKMSKEEIHDLIEKVNPSYESVQMLREIRLNVSAELQEQIDKIIELLKN